MQSGSLIEAKPIQASEEPTGAVAVRTHALSKEFGGRLVLHSLDFRVDPGELVAVGGKNGCGKSNPLRPICGVGKPSNGLGGGGGERVTGLSRHPRLSVQDRALFTGESIQANVPL